MPNENNGVRAAVIEPPEAPAAPELALASDAPGASPAAEAAHVPARKPGFLVVFLLVAFVGMTALDIYQDIVIRRQSYELKWMLRHGTFHIDPKEALETIPPSALPKMMQPPQGQPSVAPSAPGISSPAAPAANQPATAAPAARQ